MTQFPRSVSLAGESWVLIPGGAKVRVVVCEPGQVVGEGPSGMPLRLTEKPGGAPADKAGTGKAGLP